MGYPVITYPPDLQSFVDALKDSDQVNDTQIDLDLGVYFNVNPNLTVGVAIIGAGDRYEIDNSWIQFNTISYNVSALYHVKSQFEGLYVRADLGSAKVNLQDDDGANENTDSGLGYLLGLGYSFPISSGTRLAPYVHYFGASIEEETVSKVAFGVSFIF